MTTIPVLKIVGIKNVFKGNFLNLVIKWELFIMIAKKKILKRLELKR